MWNECPQVPITKIWHQLLIEAATEEQSRITHAKHNRRQGIYTWDKFRRTELDIYRRRRPRACPSAMMLPRSILLWSLSWWLGVMILGG